MLTRLQRDQAITDPVTGAYARALLGRRLADELDLARRLRTDCSVCLFDLDYFKSVNDAYGHARGDQVLGQIVERVRALLRGSDAVFRYGGDEFVVLLPGADSAKALRLAERLVAAV